MSVVLFWVSLGGPWVASGPHFASLVAFAATFVCFLCISGCSKLDFGAARDAPGKLLEASKHHVSRFLGAFACSWASVVWMLRLQQNTGRSGTQRTSEHVGHPTCDAKNEHQSVQQFLEHGFVGRACENEVLERSGTNFCRVWASPGRLLGGASAFSGRSWALLGASWAHPGCTVGAFERLLVAKRRPRQAPARFFIDVGSIRALFSKDWAWVSLSQFSWESLNLIFCFTVFVDRLEFVT